MFTTVQCQFLNNLRNWRQVDLTNDRDYLFYFWETIFRDRVRQIVDTKKPEQDPLETLEETFEVQHEPYLGYFKGYKDSVDEDGEDHDPHILGVLDKSFVLPHGDELSFFIYWLYDEFGTVINSIVIGSAEIYLGDTFYIPATKENIVTIHKTISDTIIELGQYYQDHVALRMSKKRREQEFILNSTKAILFSPNSLLYPYRDGVQTALGTAIFKLSINWYNELHIELNGVNFERNAQWTLINPSTEDIQQLLPVITEKIGHIKRIADEIAAQDVEDNYPF